MKPIFAAALAASLFSASLSHAQTNTDPNQGVNRIGAAPGTHSAEVLPQFSGNLPSTINEDRTHGVNAPGTLIGPQPENGEPDPRFPNDSTTGGSGGGSEINSNSSSHTTSQSATGASKWPGQGQVGGTTSNITQGLPSASYANDGGSSQQGSGGNDSGNEGNLGSDARSGYSAADNQNHPEKMDREVSGNTLGAAPFAIGAGAVILGAFLFGVLRSRGQKRRA